MIGVKGKKYICITDNPMKLGYLLSQDRRYTDNQIWVA